MQPHTRSGWIVRVLLSFVVALCAPGVADAAGLLVPRDGSPPIRLRSHRVVAVLDDGLARTTVRQTFVNPHGRALEAVYTFPVPDGAALVDLALEVGGQRLEGLLAERRTARRAYDTIVRGGRDPALVEQIGKSTFRLSVFPVLPDQETVVEIAWIAPVPLVQGEYRYVYPLADGGPSVQTDHDLTFSLRLHSSAPIESATSPSDGMAVYLKSPNDVSASVERTGARLDRDLVVAAKVATPDPSLSLRTFRPAKGDPYFAAVVTPPEVSEDRVLPRDVTLVLDTSGSMEGEKIEQARSAADWILRNLRAKDRVNVLLFSDEVRPLADAPADATFDHVEAARRFVLEAKAAGGTALGDAIRFANAAPTAPGRVAMAVLLTDGLPTVGEGNPATIVSFAKAGSDRGIRTFLFGVGADVNAALLDGVAQAGRGASEVFRPQGEIESRLRAFAARTSSPVLSNLRLEIDGKPVLDVLPRPIPDLFLGEQVVMSGRAPLAGRHEFVLRGVMDGREIALSGSADFGAPSADGAAWGEAVVRDLYARRKLEFLAQAHRMRLGLTDDAYFAALDRGSYSTADELVKAMIDVSLETGVQCAYTSFLALLPEDRARLDPRDTAALDEALRRATAKRREIAGLPPRRTAAATRPAAPATAETPPAPEETKPLEESERLTEDPVLRDAKVSDHNETDTDMETEESLGDPRFNADSPFEGPGTNRTIGIGGGAGGAFGGRRGGHRSLKAGGAGKATQTAVDLDAEWLSRHQSPDGRWDSDGFASLCKANACDGAGAPDGDVGATGLALLCYLGAGETHQSGNYKDTVKRGLLWLRSVQDSEGCFGPRTSPRWMYQHLVATLAMTEAYGMTQSVLFKDAAQRAVNFVHQCQNPYAGWGPGVRDGTNDTILTAWAVLCLRSAQIAELDVDRSAFVGAMTWTASMTDPATGAVGATVRGVAPPLPAPGEAKFPPATAASLDAAGAVIRIQCLAGLAKPGERPDLAADPFVVRATERLRAAPPRWDEAAGTIDAQAWFLGSSAAWQIGGDTWKTWSDALRRAVVDAQCTETGRDERGSWAPHGPYAKEGGRIYSTTLLTLCMETFYRYARVVGVR